MNKPTGIRMTYNTDNKEATIYSDYDSSVRLELRDVDYKTVHKIETAIRQMESATVEWVKRDIGLYLKQYKPL